MTTGGKSACVGARVGVGVGLGAGDTAALRKLERILEARSIGHKVERIAYDLRLIKASVQKLIAARRAAGDPRALTDKQAVVASEARAARQEEARRAADARREQGDAIKAEAGATLDAMVEERRSAPLIAVASERAAWIERLQSFASAYAAHPKVAAGFLHLADLHRHHESFYPALNIASEGATLESTRRRFPPVSRAAFTGGGPAAACLAG